jgi:iron complex outermembrane recepter protein
MTMRLTVCGLALTLSGTVAVAQQPSPESIRLKIDSQRLDKALNTWAAQTGYQVLTEIEGATRGKVSPSIDGTYTPEGALKILLASSDLKYEFVNSKTVSVRKAEGGVNTPSAAAQRTDSSPETKEAQRPLALAQNRPREDQAAVTDGIRNIEPVKELRVAIPEVLVQGSRSFNTGIVRNQDDVQPYVVFDRETISRSGARDVDEFLGTQLPMNAVPANLSAQQTSGILAGNTQIDLRGLGTNQTLILIDGHRVAGWNNIGVGGQPDLNGVPLAAIERIEVLPMTASGIHGGSATGGVINVVLRRDYAGFGTSLTYENSFDGGGITRRVDLHGGFNLEDGRTNILLTGTYSNGGALLAADRDFVQRGRDHILENSPGVFFDSPVPPLGATTNIRSTTDSLELKPEFGGTTLPANFTSVPYGYSGIGTDGVAALVGNAGQYNFDLANTAQAGGGGRRALLATPEIKAMTAALRRTFSPRVDARLEFNASDSESRYRTSEVAGVFLLPSTAPNNPFTQDVLVTTPLFGADAARVSELESRRAVAGITVKLAADWSAGFDYTWNRVRYSSFSPPQALDPGAADAVAIGTIDILRDTNEGGADFSPFNVGVPLTYGPAATKLQDAVLHVGGPVRLPFLALTPTLTVALAHRKEELSAFTQVSPFSVITEYPRSQSADSVYAEASVPLVSSAARIPGVELLELQMAVRAEEYENTGSNTTIDFAPEDLRRVTNKLSSVDPTFGVRYQPFRDLLLRSSYSTGFRPPDMNQFVPSVPLEASPGEFFGITDPLRGNELVGMSMLVFGGNPDLRPEQSESWSIGAVLTPRVVPGLRFSVDWLQIDKKDNIEVLSPVVSQTDLENAIAFAPHLITRGPNLPGDQPGWAGPITGITQTWINISEAHVEALDFAFSYERATSLGSFDFRAAGTRSIHLTRQFLPNVPDQESTGTGTALKWRANATLSWTYQQLSLAWTSRYFDSYWIDLTHEVNPIQGAAKIPSQTYHDIAATYRFGRLHAGGSAGASWSSRMFDEAEIQLGVKNVFNEDPPVQVVDFTSNFYSLFGDPRLASYYLSLKMNF